jgi:epoxyqueuosine reductase
MAKLLELWRGGGAARPTLRWRLLQRAADTHLIGRLLDPACPYGPFTKMYRHLPALPGFVTARLGTEPALGPRTLAIPELPAALRTGPGTPIDEVAATSAFNEQPVQNWNRVHPEAVAYLFRKWWLLVLLSARGMSSALHLVGTVQVTTPRAGIAKVGAAELTKAVKARGREIGLSSVGIAMYDPNYVYDEFLTESDGDRVVVCVLEQSWAATQTAPSLRSERSVFNTYSRIIPLADELADYLRSLGYTARAGDPLGRVLTIPYAVKAGIGQLGLNGQLLTPFAGSRCRLVAITTNAPLVADTPVDYGIPAICDACKVCVRRCPSGAIVSKREMHRGVHKAKIKTERCLPMVVLANGCAVCMKVCPVQRYGLPDVIAEYRRSGHILGKDTDELEGYTWPIDGIHYGPGDKPKHAVTEPFLQPRGLVFDPERRQPPLPQTGELEALNQGLKDGAT